jgi:DNA-directed RNA polymerase specialized sigma24 family protein
LENHFTNYRKISVYNYVLWYTKNNLIFDSNGGSAANMERLVKIFSVYHEFLFRIVLMRTKNVDDAKEILQDTFADALTYFDPNKHIQILPWLITIAKNNTFTFLKRKRNYEQIDNYIEILPAPIDQITLEIYLSSIMKSGFDVPDELLKHLFLYILDGVPLTEIAKKTNIPYVKLRYWKNLMLKELRKRYEDEKFF